MSYNDVLFELQDYILNNKNIEKALAENLFLSQNDKNRKIETVQKYDKIEEPKQTNVKPQLNIPKQKDMLFWCYYIIKNGDSNYDMLHKKTDLTAKQLKIELVTTIRKNKDIVKQYKSIQTKVQDKNDKFTLLSIVSQATQDGYDVVFACAIEIIKLNYEEEEKQRLFREKVKQLEELFKSESLDNLKEINLFDKNGQKDSTGIGLVEQGDEQGQDGDRESQESDD